MRAAVSGVFCAAALLGVLARLPKEALTPAPPAAETHALAFQIAGCGAVRRGPICEVTAARRQLVVWIPDAAQGPVEVRFGGQPISPERSREVDGGRTLELTLPALGATPGLIPLEVSAAAARSTLFLEEVSGDAVIERVQSLRKAGQLDEALALMPAWSSLPPDQQARARSLSARLALAKGEIDHAIEELNAAKHRHHVEGRLSDEVLDAFALAHTLTIKKRSFGAARDALDSVSEALARWDEGRAQVGYYRALISRESGSLRSAAGELAETERAAGRLGLAGFRKNVRESLARLYQTMGDHERAVELLDALERELGDGAPACDRASVMTNRGWSELALQGIGLPAATAVRAPRSPGAPATRTFVDDPGPESSGRRMSRAALTAYLERTLALWENDCRNPAEVANLRLDLALAALLVSDSRGARSHLDLARSQGMLPAFVSEWVVEIEARLAILEGDAREAVKLYGELEARARAARAPELAWRAAVGLGIALESSGDDAGAEAHYRRAEALLEEHAAQVPVNGGRVGFLVGRDRGVRLLVDLLLRRGDRDAAWAAIARARVRALRSAETLERLEALPARARRRWERAMGRYAVERDAFDATATMSWSLPADRMAALVDEQRARDERARSALDEAFAALGPSRSVPAEVGAAQGELVLAFQLSADEKTLHVLARTPSGVRASDVPLPLPRSSRAKLSEALLGPFAEDIAAAERLEVLDAGPVSTIDIHALPLRGEPLLRRLPVVYAVGLGSASRPVGRRSATALFVADTKGDLPASRAEVEAADAILGKSWSTRRLLGPAATRTDVLQELGRVDRFHFASHATFDATRPWDSALHLADGTALRAGDILSLPLPPATVVLSGCDTATARPTRVADMSLARAFLVAGAEVVVAASRPVEDKLAAALLARAYELEPQNGGLGRALREAQLELAKARPDADWAAYRIITR